MLDWLACTLVRAASAVLCRLPPSAATGLGGALGSLAARLQPKRARIGLSNVRAAFDGALSPDAARRIIRACYRQLGAGILELLRLPVMDRAYAERYVTIEGQERFEHAVASGRPVILLTGHFGNWELSSIVAALHGHPIVALARAQNTLPRLYALLVSFRQSKGCRIVHKGSAMRQLFEALDRGQLIGIVGDQASRRGMFVEFFGRPALFATGPFALAYRKHALLLPAFIHRVRGPHHRLVIEPPIAVPSDQPEDAAVSAGIEQFAAALSRHIREDPAQWLWMHKRWKRTPARRALVLSDGKLGHLKQSLAVVAGLRQSQPQTTHTVVEIRYRSRAARALAVLWSWWMPRGWGAARCLRWTLAPASAQALLTRQADLIVSCGASAAPANVLWSRENLAKSVVIMNPAPLPARRFDLVIAPRHDRLRDSPNILRTPGAIVAPAGAEEQRLAQGRLAAHPRYQRPAAGIAPAPHTVAVFIGGDTPAYAMTPAFADALISQVLLACEAADAWCLVTTSRRTAPGVERVVSERAARHPRCRLLLLASRDALDGTMDGMLASAEVAIVTGESISMVSEACAAGRQVLVVEPPPRPRAARRWSGRTKPQRFLRELAAEGYVHVVALPELSDALRSRLREPQAIRRLESLAPVRDALARLV